MTMMRSDKTGKKLYLLQVTTPGRILELDPDTGGLRTLVAGLNTHPDGIAIDPLNRRLFVTYMGAATRADSSEFFQADGRLESMTTEGRDRRLLAGNGIFVTGKQLIHDAENGLLYWCDREGMRVFCAREDGSDLKVLVQTGLFPADSGDYTRHCVGVAIDNQQGYIYWTLKGPPKGGQGQILRAGLRLPRGSEASNRPDIEVMLSGLPEPIDLDYDAARGIMYWTDRGDDASGGNSLNCARLVDGRLTDHQILARGLQEAIALVRDTDNQRMWITDLGGNVWEYSLSQGGPLRSIARLGALTGIAYG